MDSRSQISMAPILKHLLNMVSFPGFRRVAREREVPFEVRFNLSSPFDGLQFGGACLEKLLLEHGTEFQTVLDIGSGEGLHAEILRQFGKDVTEVDLGESEYYLKNDVNRNILHGDYLDMSFPRQFDMVWACHVLEHQKNVNHFLCKVFLDLRVGGMLGVTVPPLKHEVVGGHLTIWNAGLLLYNLVLAGFDCHAARILQYDYNISVIVQKEPIDLPKLSYDKGDIEKLLQFFPSGLSEPFNGDIRELNWN